MHIFLTKMNYMNNFFKYNFIYKSLHMNVINTTIICHLFQLSSLSYIFIMDLVNFQAIQQFFAEGNTLTYAFRKKQLQLLYATIQQHEAAIFEALYKDLHKSKEEAYTTEIGFIYAEISHALTQLQNWMLPQKVSTPIILQPSSSTIYRVPLGVTCIIAPWNYPFQLLMAPLIGAIAGGNCAVVKPSEFTPHTAAIIQTIITQAFTPNYIAVCVGDGATVVTALLQQNRFNHIFFTGSTTVGKAIAQLAAEKLTPTTLELGGKSPCIVDETANIKVAAKRIVWGKFTNAGQTCVAPDYVLVHSTKKELLIAEMKNAIQQFYGTNAAIASDYGRIVNNNRFQILCSYMQQGKILYGGESDADSLYIAPTLIELEAANMDISLMQDEIFGPILPIIEYENDDTVLSILQKHLHPLSLYLFSSNKKKQNYFIEHISFGGGCINNTLMHLGNPELPFGGLMNSGMGQYHGKYSFETFTRPKSMLNTATWLDAHIKYPPYTGMLKFLKWFLK